MTMPAPANSKGVLTMGRILIVLGMVAIAFAIWSFLFGDAVKPLGQMGDGLSMWQLIGICAALIGIVDAALGIFIIKQAQRAMLPANLGSKR